VPAGSLAPFESFSWKSRNGIRHDGVVHKLKELDLKVNRFTGSGGLMLEQEIIEERLEAIVSPFPGSSLPSLQGLLLAQELQDLLLARAARQCRTGVSFFPLVSVAAIIPSSASRP
jgi:hypothetical protein